MKPPWKGEEKVKQLNNKTIMNFYEFLLPICICVILPAMIVWFVSRARQNETNRKAEIMLKAIENGQSIDPEIFSYRPDIFICGHSHILKVMQDHSYNMLYVNPGAAGIQGWHVVRTALRFKIEGGEIKDMEVFELPRS